MRIGMTGGRAARALLIGLTVRPGGNGEPRSVKVAAMPAPVHWLQSFALLLTEIAGIAFVSAAAWLVWSRPSAMSWGFFLYAIWFNPGQDFVYFLILQD